MKKDKSKTAKIISQLEQGRDFALKEFDKIMASALDVNQMIARNYAAEIYGHLSRNMTPFLAAGEFFERAYNRLTQTEKDKFDEILKWIKGGEEQKYFFAANRYEALFSRVTCTWEDVWNDGYEYRISFSDEPLQKVLSTAAARTKDIKLINYQQRAIAVSDELAEKLLKPIDIAYGPCKRRFHKYTDQNGDINWLWTGAPKNMYTVQYDTIVFPVDTTSPIMQRPVIKNMLRQYKLAANNIRLIRNQRNQIKESYDQKIRENTR